MIRNKFGAEENPKVENKNKILGVIWNKAEDKLCFDFNEIVKKFKENATKRQVIQAAIASIYDPLGLINPVIVKFKVFFQKLCAIKLDWDDKLPEQLHDGVGETEIRGEYHVPKCRQLIKKLIHQCNVAM